MHGSSTGRGQVVIADIPFTNGSSSSFTSHIFSKFDESSKPDIFYSLEITIYGQIIIASTNGGICYQVFFCGAYLIPCHRVIKSTGDIGQYHWGTRA